RTTASNVKLNKEKIQREGDSDGRRHIKNDNNDNLSEEKYSRDVDYAEYAYRYSPDFIFLKIKKRDSRIKRKGQNIQSS
ncbi:MAG: hypothetical protein MR281_01565, partial [Eubacterium sp.]|nr:hypothetical protein [Eubacterium sp.]